MLPDIQRTIVALASGARPGERAIIRLAGPDTRKIIANLCPELPAAFLQAAQLTWSDGHCYLPLVQKHLPITLIYWPDERSYTGSPAAEIHMPGCVPLAEAVLARCCELGAVPAQKGEFTLRAFLSGKLDLAQAEAVLGIIEADSSVSLRAALSQLGGNLAPAIAPLRTSVLDILAELEAGLDFVDEDIQFISHRQIEEQLARIIEQLDQFSWRLETRSSTDRVPRVVLTGLPNSGKSSLFNALCQQPLAIVADVPGTTRDYLQHRIHFGETAFDLIDTAGWEEWTEATPRGMAQAQLQRCLVEAELVVLCIDSQAMDNAESFWRHLQRELGAKSWLVVAARSDLVAEASLPGIQSTLCAVRDQLGAQDGLIVSQNQPSTIEQLLVAIYRALLARESQSGRQDAAGPLSVVHETAVRCRAALAAARAGLQAALEAAQHLGPEELIAAELRLVLDDLSTIIGEIHSDDVLGEIFQRFCIGK